MPRVEAVPRQPAAGCSDLDVALAGRCAPRLDPRARGRTPRARRAKSGVIPARAQSSARSISPPAARSAGGRRAVARRALRVQLSRITRSGRNSSRWSRRMVSQPLDVVVGEEAVAAARPRGGAGPDPRGSGSSRWRRPGTPPAGARRRRRSCGGADPSDGVGTAVVVMARGTSVGTCRSAPRRRRESSARLDPSCG